MSSKNKRPVIHRGKTFDNGERIPIDGGARFEHCVFRHCTLVYRANGAVGFSDCQFDMDHIKWVFEDDARLMLEFLTMLYAHGGGASALIEATFDNIRKGQHPIG